MNKQNLAQFAINLRKQIEVFHPGHPDQSVHNPYKGVEEQKHNAEDSLDPDKVKHPVKKFAAHLKEGDIVSKGYGQKEPTHKVVGSKSHPMRGGNGTQNLVLEDLKTGKQSHVQENTYSGYTHFTTEKQVGTKEHPMIEIQSRM